MKLTQDTFRLYAMKAYDHPMCLNEHEFDEDLMKLTKIRKSLSHYRSGYSSNVHTIINNFISFYNVFEHHRATELLFFRLTEDQYPYANAVLMYLCLPMGPGTTNETLYLEIVDQFGNPRV